MINILVPTDFSDAAKKALEYAVFVAKKTKAKLVILHIYHIPVISAIRSYAPSPEKVREDARLAEEKLNNLENEMMGLNEINYSTKSLPMYWLTEIPDIIQDQHADLIIMGTNGASGLKKVILGSNTAKVIDISVCPVLAVPVNAKCTKIENIGFAIDREFVEHLTTFDFLVWFVKQFNALVDIFHVNGPDQDIDHGPHQININRLREYLDTIEHSYNEIADKDVEAGIQQYVQEKNIDLLALMHRSRGLFERLFKKSISETLSYHASTPLLVISEKKFG